MTAVKELDLRPAPEERFTPLDMADLLASGLSGMALVRALHHHFPKATRGEVYLAAGTAIAIMQADITIAELELKILRESAPGAGVSA